MDKKIISIIVVILIAVSGGIAYLATSTSDTADMATMRAKASDNSPPAMTAPAGSQGQPGAYTTYTPSAISSTSGAKLLFFHASWCPQCRALEADIKSNVIPSGVTIIKVDYDSNQALRKKYGVTLQTTVVRVDDQGNLVKKFVAYDDPSLKAITQELL